VKPYHKMDPYEKTEFEWTEQGREERRERPPFRKERRHETREEIDNLKNSRNLFAFILWFFVANLINDLFSYWG